MVLVLNKGSSPGHFEMLPENVRLKLLASLDLTVNVFEVAPSVLLYQLVFAAQHLLWEVLAVFRDQLFQAFLVSVAADSTEALSS